MKTSWQERLFDNSAGFLEGILEGLMAWFRLHRLPHHSFPKCSIRLTERTNHRAVCKALSIMKKSLKLSLLLSWSSALSSRTNVHRPTSLAKIDPEKVRPFASRQKTESMPWTQNIQAYGRFQESNEWASAYQSTHSLAVTEYFCENVEGTVPSDIRGDFFKAGPGNMERGGKRYRHVLDGDGFVAMFRFRDGLVSYTGRFVETEYYREEEAADSILYRNVFGTERCGAFLTKAFDLAIKNCANTNILKWGDRLFALWEGGRPYELDPNTLETLSQKKCGPFRELGDQFCKIWGVTIDNGGLIDRRMHLGKFFTAHPHVVNNRLIAFRGARNPLTNSVDMEFCEFSPHWEETSCSRITLRDCVASPHDFSVSETYYIFFENRLKLDKLSFLMGLKSVSDAMKLQLDKPGYIHVVPRGHCSAKMQALKIELPVGYFNVHNIQQVFQDGDVLTVYSNGWDLKDKRYFATRAEAVPFLGNWAGEYPSFRAGCVPPSLLYKTVVELTSKRIISHEPLIPGLVMEFPITDDIEENTVYCASSSTDGTALPFSGIAKIVTARNHTSCPKVDFWWAESATFTGETIPVVKRNGETGSWLLTLVYDTANNRTSLVVLDSENLSEGPICRIHLRHRLTMGLHSSFSAV